YDGHGRLRIRAEWAYIGGADGDWFLQSETHYIYDGWRVIQERDAANTPQVAYTRGPDLSGTLEGAGGIGGLLARSHDFAYCCNILTVRVTNSSPDTLSNITIYTDSTTYVTGG